MKPVRATGPRDQMRTRLLWLGCIGEGIRTTEKEHLDDAAFRADRRKGDKRYDGDEWHDSGTGKGWHTRRQQGSVWPFIAG